MVLMHGSNGTHRLALPAGASSTPLYLVPRISSSVSSLAPVAAAAAGSSAGGVVVTATAGVSNTAANQTTGSFSRFMFGTVAKARGQPTCPSVTQCAASNSAESLATTTVAAAPSGEASAEAAAAVALALRTLGSFDFEGRLHPLAGVIISDN